MTGDRLGRPLGAPLDRCLALAAYLPLPAGTSARDRDILWACLSRRATGRSMPAIGAEYGVGGGQVRAIALRTMARQGIRGLRYDDPAASDPWAPLPGGGTLHVALGKGLGPLGVHGVCIREEATDGR